MITHHDHHDHVYIRKSCHLSCCLLNTMRRKIQFSSVVTADLITWRFYDNDPARSPPLSRKDCTNMRVRCSSLGSPRRFPLPGHESEVRKPGAKKCKWRGKVPKVVMWLNRELAEIEKKIRKEKPGKEGGGGTFWLAYQTANRRDKISLTAFNIEEKHNSSE